MIKINLVDSIIDVSRESYGDFIKLLPIPLFGSFTPDELSEELGRKGSKTIESGIQKLWKDGYITRYPFGEQPVVYNEHARKKREDELRSGKYIINPYAIPKILLRRITQPFPAYRFRKKWGLENNPN